MENFHSISRAANQRALTQITSVILMMTTIKDLFSPQALFLITLICRGNKWILTKCKRGGMQRGLDKQVWQKVCGVRLRRFLGVKWLLWWGMVSIYQWNEISWLQVSFKYGVWSNYLVRVKSVICSDTLASSIWMVSLVYLPVLQQMNGSIVWHMNEQLYCYIWIKNEVKWKNGSGSLEALRLLVWFKQLSCIGTSALT